MTASPRSVGRRPPWHLAAVFGLGGLALRIVHLVTIADSPLFRYPYIDLAMYDEWAQRIAAGQWVREAPFFLDPLYPYLVAIVYAVFGANHLALATVQSLLGAAIAPLLYLETRRQVDETTARVAAGMAAVYLPLVYWGPILMKPVVTTFLVTVGLVCVARLLTGESRRRWWVATGVVWALAGLTRTSLLLAVPLLLILAAFLAPRSEGAAGRGRRVRAGWAIAGMLAVLVLPLAHNLAGSGEPILSTSNHGAIYYIGNNPENPSGAFMQFPFMNARPEFEHSDFLEEAQRRSGRPLSYRQASRFWFVESLRWMRAEPLSWLRTTWSKLRLFWGVYQTPASLDYYLYRQHAPVLRLPLLEFGLLGPLALTGLVLSCRRRGWLRFLALFVGIACAAAVAFFVLSRFRMVVVPALFVFGAIGAVESIRRARRAFSGEGWRPATIAVGLLVAGWAFVDLPVRLPASTMGYRIADALRLPRRPETTAMAHRNLGMMLAAVAGDDEDPESTLLEAERELTISTSLGGDDATAWVELGKVRARLGRNSEAIEAYDEARTLNPTDYRALHALGILNRRTGDLPAAAEAYRGVLQIHGTYLPSAVALGEVSLELGRYTEAVQAFELALRLRPDHAAARRGLARARARLTPPGSPG